MCVERVIRRHRGLDSQAGLRYSSNQVRPETTFVDSSNFTPSAPRAWNGWPTSNGTDYARSTYKALWFVHGYPLT